MNKEIRAKMLLCAFIGTSLGFIFVVIATYIELDKEFINFSYENVRELYRENDLLKIIGTAPFFLGILSAIAGFVYSKNILITRELIRSKKNLKKYVDFLEKKTKNLYEISEKDDVTGLQNAHSIMNKELKSDSIVYIINISCFREINSIFGYKNGNRLLKDFGQRLLNNNFECYKLVGDEFALVDYIEADNFQLDILANYIFELISNEAFYIDDQEVFVTIKMGIATYRGSEGSKEYIMRDLIYDASYALKYAKEKKLQYAIYTQELKLERESRDSFHWKKKIIEGIAHKKFMTFYQPIRDNYTGKIAKYETLIRFSDEDKSVMSPIDFLSASRKYNLYNYLTRFVFLDACDTLTTSDSEVSINLSIEDIRDINTKKLIFNKISTFPLANKLIFELLESEGVDNYSEVMEFIKEVKKYGCKIAIDDFGSGYSSFEHILALNIDFIKIDASLIKNLHNDKTSQYMVEAIVNLAKKLNVKTIAEYVHSAEVQSKVEELKIDYSQGYYIGEPKKYICRE